MIRGILFDYGNTLVRVRDGAVALRDVLAQLGQKVDETKTSEGMASYKQHWQYHYAGLPRGERWTEEIRLDCCKEMLKRLGFASDLDRFAGEVAKRWASNERQGMYDDVEPTLGALDEMGIELGVLSQNTMTGTQLRDDLETRQIARFFSVVLTSEDIGYDKPDPRFFEAGSKMIQLKNSELLYVGNRYHEDVLGARNAGMTPVLIERGGHRHKTRDCLALTSLVPLPSILKDNSEKSA